MRHNGINGKEGRGNADYNPTAIFLGVPNDTELVDFEAVALAFFKAVGVVATDPKFDVPAKSIPWASNADNTMSLSHHLGGGGSFLDAQHVILEADHLRSNHLNAARDMEAGPNTLPIGPKGQHVGGADLQANLSLGAHPRTGDLRQVIWTVCAALDKGKVLKPNFLTIMDWKGILIMRRKGSKKQEFGLLEILDHVCWEPKGGSGWV